MKTPTLLSPADRIVLAPGVTWRDGALVDPIRAAVLPLNGTGAELLGHLPCTIGDLAAVLREEHGLDSERTLADATAFAATLNAALVANVEPRGRSLHIRMLASLRPALTLALAGVMPSRIRYPYRRTALPDGSPRATARVVGRAMLVPGLRAAAITTLPLAVVMAWSGMLVLPVLIAAAAALLVGPAVHELGHALALRGTPGALVTSGIGAFVAHGPIAPERVRRIALAGPLTCLALAAVVVGTGVAVSSLMVAGTGLLLGLQAVSLTVLSADGRNAVAGLASPTRRAS